MLALYLKKNTSIVMSMKLNNAAISFISCTKPCLEKVIVAIQCILYAVIYWQCEKKGPLTTTSAFKFENFYSELRHSFQPGTISPLKQMLQAVLLKRSIGSHYCTTSIHYSSKDTVLECNSLIYVYENNRYNLYVIHDSTSDQVMCYRLGRYPVQFTNMDRLDWSSIGVFKKGGIIKNNVTINKSNISGKLLNVGEYIITCPTSVLREK